MNSRNAKNVTFMPELLAIVLLLDLSFVERETRSTKRDYVN